MRLLATLGLFACLLAAPALAQQGAAPAPTAAAPLEPADWSKDQNWLCRPGRQDACTINLDATIVAADGSLKREAFTPDPNAAIDCFYIYPTVSNDNFSISDLVAGPEERSVVERQFARFGSKCRMYAPMYRQTTLTQLRARLGGATAPPQRSSPAQSNADIDEAFDYYMKNDNKGRGIVFIGHSQGAGQLTRLLAAKVDGTPIQKQLVSALIVGSGFQVAKGKDVGGSLKSIPVCKTSNDVGCVVAYASYRDTVPPAAGTAVGVVKATADKEGVCVNPATLVSGKDKADADSYWSVSPAANGSLSGPPRWSSKSPLYTGFAKVPGLVSTQCVDRDGRKWLEVHVNADPKDTRADDIPNDVMKDGAPDPFWGLHNADLNIGIGDLVELVGRQAKTYAGKK